jgi:hypothetical protein
MMRPTFEDEITFLRRHAEVEVLASPAGGRIAVCARFQGRVMTSAVREGGSSLGFVNHRFIESGLTGTPFDNFGGEDRFWLGPEGGQHGFFFAPGAPFALESWQVPAALQVGSWPSRRGGDGAIVFQKALRLTSHGGEVFDVGVERTIRLLGAAEVAVRFGVTPPAGARWVAFESSNSITNDGAHAWTREKGRPSVWILNQYPTSKDARIIVPLRPGPGRVVNDRYFGKVPEDRLIIREREGYLLFRGDGQHRGKIGIAPARTSSMLGSYTPDARLLTLVRYDKAEGAHDYVNSMWERQVDPYGGDVINSYNDGPIGGKTPVAPFYELETSSPAAGLSPGETLVHANSTLHVIGEPTDLDAVCRPTLGITVAAATF